LSAISLPTAASARLGGIALFELGRAFGDQIGGGFSFRIAEQGFQILVCKRGELFVRPIDHNENFSFRIVLR
jgi:hypothetical protein